jgi:NAD+ synthase
VTFLKDAFQKSGFSRAVIATSGGVDSSTSLALAVRAQGAGNVYPMLLPYGDFNAQGDADARAVITMLGIPHGNATIVDIRPFVDQVVSLDSAMDVIRRGNVMARMRMTVLFDHAKKHSALVVGTENRSEHLLGYFTRFGDEASDIEPLRNLYKTQVYELARFLGIPKPILEKKPTAGLWEGQTDEGEFGFTYKDADEILFLLYDEKKSVEEIVVHGIARDVVEKVKAWVEKNSFKHHLPIVPTS